MTKCNRCEWWWSCRKMGCCHLREVGRRSVEAHDKSPNEDVQPATESAPQEQVKPLVEGLRDIAAIARSAMPRVFLDLSKEEVHLIIGALQFAYDNDPQKGKVTSYLIGELVAAVANAERILA